MIAVFFGVVHIAVFFGVVHIAVLFDVFEGLTISLFSAILQVISEVSHFYAWKDLE